MKQIVAVFYLAFFALCAKAQDDTTFKPVELPAGFTSQLNVVYTTVGSWQGKMDIYLPPATSQRRLLSIFTEAAGIKVLRNRRQVSIRFSKPEWQ